jgi:hypothetical protein
MACHFFHHHMRTKWTKPPSKRLGGKTNDFVSLGSTNIRFIIEGGNHTFTIIERGWKDLFLLYLCTPALTWGYLQCEPVNSPYTKYAAPLPRTLQLQTVPRPLIWRMASSPPTAEDIRQPSIHGPHSKAVPPLPPRCATQWGGWACWWFFHGEKRNRKIK